MAEAFRKYPKVFDALFVNMLQVGESGGMLDVVLQRLPRYIEKAAKLKRKVKGAMVYPLTIISVAVLVIIFMLTFVIPTFADMFPGTRRRPTAADQDRHAHVGLHAQLILVMIVAAPSLIYGLKQLLRPPIKAAPHRHVSC